MVRCHSGAPVEGNQIYCKQGQSSKSAVFDLQVFLLVFVPNAVMGQLKTVGWYMEPAVGYL